MFLIVFSVAGSSILTEEGYSVTADLDDSGLSEDEITTGGIFGSGISFGRFAGFVLFGVGLPSSVPSWIQLIIAIWQTIFTLFTVGFVVSSIWDG